MNVAELIVGIIGVVLGGAGLLGQLDQTRFRLYRGEQAEDPARHRRAQRLGGALILVLGVVFVVLAFRG